jgi:hypothetical protein
MPIKHAGFQVPTLAVTPGPELAWLPLLWKPAAGARRRRADRSAAITAIDNPTGNGTTGGRPVRRWRWRQPQLGSRLRLPPLLALDSIAVRGRVIRASLTSSVASQVVSPRPTMLLQYKTVLNSVQKLQYEGICLHAPGQGPCCLGPVYATVSNRTFKRVKLSN